MRIIVYHSYYGCDTGCCGHVIEDGDGNRIGNFEFGHPYDEDKREFAESLVRGAGCDPADLDWENCVITKEC